MDGAVLWLMLMAGTWAAGMTAIFVVQALRAGRPGAREEAPAPDIRSPNAFFAQPPACGWRAPCRGPDEGIVGEVRCYLESEHAAVERFVSRPTVESLYFGTESRIFRSRK